MAFMRGIVGPAAYPACICRLSSGRVPQQGAPRASPRPAATPMTEERDPYAVLGIASSAPPDEVSSTYRTLARRHHPDVSLERDAEQRMAEINNAWSLLRDPAKRAAWDRAHGITPQVARRHTAAASPAAPRPTRSRPARLPRRPPAHDDTGHDRDAASWDASARPDLASRSGRRGRRWAAARKPPGLPAPVRAAHRVVARRGRTGRPGLSRLAPAATRGRAIPRGDRPPAGGDAAPGRRAGAQAEEAPPVRLSRRQPAGRPARNAAIRSRASAWTALSVWPSLG